jgi:DNA polymerase III psi subunit
VLELGCHVQRQEVVVAMRLVWHLQHPVAVFVPLLTRLLRRLEVQLQQLYVLTMPVAAAAAAVGPEQEEEL